MPKKMKQVIAAVVIGGTVGAAAILSQGQNTPPPVVKTATKPAPVDPKERAITEGPGDDAC
jgi:hypothetical protein